MMSDKILTKENLPAFIEELKGEYEVIGPKRSGDMFVFDHIDESEELELDYPTTRLPPKKIFLPQREPLYEYEKKEGDVVIRDLRERWDKKRVLLGVHPCDIAGLLCLDKVFGLEYDDPYYWERRNSTVIIGITCKEPCEHGFCDVMETGPDAARGYDLLMTDIGGKYYLRPGSELGEKLLKADYFGEATEDDTRRRDAAIEGVRRKMKTDLDISGIEGRMKERVDDELWSEYTERCVLCGACNFVCPTCHCFTIRDETNFTGTKGRRVRVWDACHFKNFALIAGGLNFRGKKDSRIKHRIYDKLYYSKEKYGEFFCVGCGRCATFCPAEIDIKEVARKVQEA